MNHLDQLDTIDALRLAIQALNEISNRPICISTGAIRTYDLIPKLEAAVKRAGRTVYED